MVNSINRIAEYTARANSMHAGLSGRHGDIMVGDKGFEFFNENNLKDYIQIPWNEVEQVKAQVFLKGKIIRSFTIDTKADGSFFFTSKYSGQILKAMSKHLSREQLVHAPTLINKIRLFLSKKH